MAPVEAFEPPRRTSPPPPVEAYPTTESYESFASYARTSPTSRLSPPTRDVAGTPRADFPEIVRSAPEPGREDWGIPPVPAGPSLTGADSLTADSVLRYQRLRPQSGWRKGVYSMTRGKINLGLSPADRHQADLLAAARTPITRMPPARGHQPQGWRRQDHDHGCPRSDVRHPAR